MKPIRVEFSFSDKAVAHGLDMLVTCDVTLGRPNPHNQTSGWVPGDDCPTVEIVGVAEDGTGTSRDDLIHLLPFPAIEDMAVEYAVEEEARQFDDAAEHEAEAKRFGSWDY